MLGYKQIIRFLDSLTVQVNECLLLACAFAWWVYPGVRVCWVYVLVGFIATGVFAKVVPLQMALT